MFESMEQNGLLLCERLLTGEGLLLSTGDWHSSIVGYVPGAEALAAVTNLAIKMKRTNSELIYLLDRKSEIDRPSQLLIV